MNVIDSIFNWAKKKKEEQLLNQFGGIQTCPWCKQIAQSKEGWSFSLYEKDQFLDKLTCGVCGGTSLWRFEIGMMYIGPLDSPEVTKKSNIIYKERNVI